MAMMNTKIAMRLALLCVLIKISATDLALDTEGDVLRPGVEYYVASATWCGGGGLNIGPGRNQTCPYDIIQEKFDDRQGVPVTFSPMETTDDFIHLSSNLFIKFIPDQKTLRCSESTVWKLDKFDESVYKWFLTTGGVEGDPNAWCSRFQIWSGGPAGTFIYKLAFCPSVCDSYQGCCMEIGKFSSNLLDLQRLILSDNGWPFMFVKARGRDLKHVVDV